MAKRSIDKEYLLTDDTVNVYGFRLLTSGFQIDLFKQNPIGYRMHDRDGGVVVSWEDLRIENDTVYGKPSINLSNPMGERTANEVEDGFLNGASCGRIKVLEYSDDPKLMIEGQTGPTITKWVPKEISLVDSPGNEAALSQSTSMQLFDKDDNAINLADFVHSTLKNLPIPALMGSNAIPDLNPDNMLFKNSVIAALRGSTLAPDLADNADDTTALLIVNDLIEKAKKVDTLASENRKLKEAKTEAETKLADLEKESTTKKVSDLLDKALNVDKKTTVELNAKLAVDYAANPTGLQNLLDAMTGFKSVVKNLNDEGDDVPEKFKGKDYMALFSANLLEDCKSECPALYDNLKAAHEAKKKK